MIIIEAYIKRLFFLSNKNLLFSKSLDAHSWNQNKQDGILLS